MRQTLLISLAALTLGCGGDAAAPAQPPAAPEETTARDAPASASPHETANFSPCILFLGDNLCSGAGVESYESFQSRVRLKLANDGLIFRPVERCAAGRRPAQALDDLEQVLIDLRPDLVVIALGRASGLAGLPADEIEADLEALVERARRAEARVLLLGASLPPGDGRYGGLFESLYARLAQKHKIDFIPAFDRELAGLWNEDGRTPTAQGHERLAEALVPTLSTILRELDPAHDKPLTER